MCSDRPFRNDTATPPGTDTVTTNEAGALPSPDSSNLTRPVVLVVDDEKGAREIARLFLEDQYTVELANDGCEALSVIEQRLPDLILTDLKMPRMNGVELVQAVRDSPLTKGIPIIVMTGYGDEMAGESLKAGADDYVTKPFTAAMLLARVGARLELARLRQEAEAVRQRATTILESITDGFCVFDRNGSVASLNREAERILGRKREELLGKVIWCAFPDTLGAEIHKACERAVTEQISRPLEVFHPQLEVWLDIRAYPAADGSLSVFFRDITRRKRAEEVARVNEQWLRLIIESAQDYAIFSMGLDRLITSWNSGAARIFGYAEEEIIGQVGDILFTPEDRNRGAPQEEAREAEAGGCEGERWQVRKDGSRFFASGVVRPMYGPDGALHGLTKVCRDVTERMRTMEALRASEERFRLLVEAVHDYAIILLDPAGRVVSWSSGAEQITGYKEQEIIGESFARFFTEESIAEGKPQRILEIVATEGRYEEEGWRVKKDGSRLWASCNITAIRERGVGDLCGFSLITGDITRRKQVELEREQLLETLRANDRRKDEFLAMLAHELRNPLAATKNALAVLEMSGDDDDFRWASKVLQRQVGQLTNIVDDLLDVSRITSGKIRLRKQLLDVADVVANALEAVRPLIANREHELITSVESTPLTVDGDAARLEQIVVNLLTNAAKYTENGGVIRVSAHREGREIVVSVQDSGIGIAPERLPEMFHLFTQGERSIARSEGGLGLGLTIVKTLSEMHGGNISAHSAGVGKGSEFVLRLPQASSTDSDRAPSGALVARKVASGKRILVVDDNVDTARGMGRLLKLLGHAVTMAHDGHEALKAAPQCRPEVILLDIGLPGIDGYGVASHLRQESWCQDAMIIAVSGYGQEEDRRRSREAGFDHHLVKPVDYEELKALLRRDDERDRGQSQGE